MGSLVDILTDTNQFKSGGGASNLADLHRKILRQGDNRFRIVGQVKVFWVHRFDAANGVRVMSICTKDEKGEGECLVCKKYKDSWKIINEVEKAQKNNTTHNFNEDQVRMAEIEVGRIPNPIIGFKQSCGPKRFVVFNVVDRDSDTNIKNNHCSVLCKSEYDLGISAGQRSIYEEIVKLMSRNRDEIKRHIEGGFDYLPFDINLIRSGQGINTDYDRERSESFDLTDQEKQYQRYDLTQLTTPTPEGIVNMWLTTGTKKDRDEDKQTQTPVQQQPYQQPKPTKVAQPVVQPQPAQTQSTQPYAAPAQQPVQQPVTQQPVTQQPVTQQPVTQQPVVQQPVPQQPVQQPMQQTVAVQQNTAQMDACPTCNKLIPVTSAKCQHCGEEFSSYIQEDNIPY